MSTSPNSCPKCRAPLAIPQPMPEKVTCTNCRAILRLAPVKTAAASSSSEPGQAKAPAPKMVAGYELQRELARGGLGIVYLAYHPHLKHYRAIKRPQPRANLENNILLARFRREMEAIGSLDSRHIIRAYDAGNDADGPYLVTEYLDGESLSSLASRHHPMPVSEACELVRQVALGLQAAHETGMVHRDVKPSNLMLARASGGTARVIIIDWGLVKRTGESADPSDRLTRVHTELGTPDYVSPEQIRDPRTVDIRSDIYSLGATFYFLLAGQAPFHGRSEEQKQLAQTRDEFPPLEQIRPDLPRNVIDVLKRMVRKNPAERYQTPAEVALALQPFACAEPHRMLALLAPVPLSRAAASDTARLLDEKTQLATVEPREADAQNSHRRFIWLVLGVSGLIVLSTCLVASAIGIGIFWDRKATDPIAKGKSDDAAKIDGVKDVSKDPPKLTLPNDLIHEDFSDAYNKKKVLPDGWKCPSDAIRVVKFKEEYWLENSVFGSDVHFVELPPVQLSGNFQIECSFWIPHFQAWSIRLDSPKTNVTVPIGIDFTGKVSIAGQAWQAMPSFKPHLPTQIILRRDGTKMHAMVNGETVATKDLGGVTEFETIRVYLPTGPRADIHALTMRLRSFKLTRLP